MINTIFVRAFLTLCLALLVLSLLTCLGVNTAQDVRRHAYWENALGDLLPELVADLSAVAPGESSPAFYARFTVSKNNELGRWLRLRLQQEHRVVYIEDGHLTIYWSLPVGVARLDLGPEGDAVWHRVGWLIEKHFRIAGKSPEDYSNWLAQRLKMPVMPAEADPGSILPGFYLSQLHPGEHQLVVSIEEGQWLVVEPVVLPGPLPLIGWLLVALLNLAAVALVVFWIVSSLESRLRHLDQAIGRLAAGHLSTRVPEVGTDPVGRLGVSFNKVADHIQRLMGIQREMIRAVSHELRTPVARLRFGMQIIEDVTDDAYVHRQLKGMDSDIQELDQLIDEILTYARLEEGGPLLEFQETSLVDIVCQVVDEARPPESVRVVFAGDSDDTQGDMAELESRYIHRAIQNLVGNACRYANTQVRVSCVIGNDTCRVDVEDDGPGIPEEHWGKVFQAFARLDDSRTRSSGGYGLGLSIVRRIAYWHGGRAIVGRSEELGGARFSLVWPRRHVD
ncbi:ATP-binding protein [Parathalassolituus penaei]|uniref:histidine kinase n=1 Tax=Parathalassolituus penaei TaxID=2997323 RepID=A0A9X3ITF6_9GAMM|nr:ATP-binding protein [Parathalassolituus penaei]MCY0965138.1 ATP-binding protein [Parathalassolituus penaei]